MRGVEDVRLHAGGIEDRFVEFGQILAFFQPRAGVGGFRFGFLEKRRGDLRQGEWFGRFVPQSAVQCDGFAWLDWQVGVE